MPSSGITSQDGEKSGLSLPAALGPRPPCPRLTLSVLQCRLWMGVLLALALEVGVLLAFLAVQPGQASKTGAAAFTFWPRTLGGVAQVAPTRRFSPVSHLRRREMRESTPEECEERSRPWRQCTKEQSTELWLVALLHVTSSL